MLDTTNKAVLAFWARTMCLIRDNKMSWPGFSYTEPEWARLGTLARAVSRDADTAYNIVNAAVFIAIAAAAVAGGFIPLATVLFPVPADTPAAAFLGLLAVFAALTLGLGMPVSMRIAARFSANRAALEQAGDAPEDAALAAKVRWQMRRMTLVMCGLLVPGAMALIMFSIRLGPAVTAVKWMMILLMAASAWQLRRMKPS